MPDKEVFVLYILIHAIFIPVRAFPGIPQSDLFSVFELPLVELHPEFPPVHPWAMLGAFSIDLRAFAIIKLAPSRDLPNLDLCVSWTDMREV